MGSQRIRHERMTFTSLSIVEVNFVYIYVYTIYIYIYMINCYEFQIFSVNDNIIKIIDA